MENVYPKSKDGICFPLTKEENQILGRKILAMSFADLMAMQEHCMYQQDYFQRRFQRNERPGTGNWHIQERMYSWWLWWFHMMTYVQWGLKQHISNLCKE